MDKPGVPFLPYRRPMKPEAPMVMCGGVEEEYRGSLAPLAPGETPVPIASKVQTLAMRRIGPAK